MREGGRLAKVAGRTDWCALLYPRMSAGIPLGVCVERALALQGDALRVRVGPAPRGFSEHRLWAGAPLKTDCPYAVPAQVSTSAWTSRRGPSDGTPASATTSATPRQRGRGIRSRCGRRSRSDGTLRPVNTKDGKRRALGRAPQAKLFVADAFAVRLDQPYPEGIGEYGPFDVVRPPAEQPSSRHISRRLARFGEY